MARLIELMVPMASAGVPLHVKNQEQLSPAQPEHNKNLNLLGKNLSKFLGCGKTVM
jgi:hypothetical protein